MHVNTKHHILYYTGLAVVLLTCLVLIAQSLHDLNLVMVVTVFMAFFYVVWALLHHFVHHDIHAKIVVEYVLMGILGITLVYTVIYFLK